MKKIILGVILLGAALVSISSMVFHNQTNQKTFTTTKTVKKLLVDDREMPIEIIGISGNQTRIHYQKSRGIKYKIAQTNHRLRFERKHVLDFNFLNFGKGDPKVTIEIPKAKLQNLQVDTSNGKISTKNLTLDKLELETTNSQVALTDVAAQTIETETSNGKVELSQLTFDEGSFETSNSKMALQDLTFKEGTFHTSNGQIDLMNVEPSESLFLKTSNSTINGTISGDKKDFSITAKTSNAANNLSNQQGGSKELEIKTSNGAIEVDFVH